MFKRIIFLNYRRSFFLFYPAQIADFYSAKLLPECRLGYYLSALISFDRTNVVASQYLVKSNG